MIDKTCLSYWFPKIKAAGLPVPETRIVSMPQEAFRDIFRLFDGEKPTGEMNPFLEEVKEAADLIGYPCFLRTGQTSGKHNWEKTCFIQSRKDIPSHVISLVEFSEMAQLMGLACDVWAVREYLPIIPLAVCPSYSNMPVCHEFRFFVEDSSIKCSHPYWPLEALERGSVPKAERQHIYDKLCELPDPQPLEDIASAAGAAVGGAWSVDILETKRGWYLTDMAEAHKSFHWEGCSAN